MVILENCQSGIGLELADSSELSRIVAARAEPEYAPNGRLAGATTRTDFVNVENNTANAQELFAARANRQGAFTLFIDLGTGAETRVQSNLRLIEANRRRRTSQPAAYGSLRCRNLSRMPLTNWALWALPNRLASSTASLMAARSGVSV
jgi:hypothetical protein